MKLYIEIIKLLFNKSILKKNIGASIKEFSEEMGIVYIKLAQILATQNYGKLFTEEDRITLSSICDNCNPIKYSKIKKKLKKEYGKKLNKIFRYIEQEPIGSASVSQVHRAILKNGEEVAIKIKRKDITNKIEKDIKKIKTLIHRYGKVFHFGNFKGADLALDLYLEWIKQEIDFNKEKENIKIYSEYTKNVNKKVKNTKKLKVPKLYEEYCTNNIIVMGFIKSNTINKMKLTKKNKEKIVDALNSYIKLNFWAMFNNQPIAFHGDPHSANLSIDENGNLYFLDMGLLFVLDKNESNLCRDFFLAIYSKNYEKLYNMLVIYGNMNDKQKIEFKQNCKRFVEEVQDKNITHYFIDLIEVCLKFEFVPPAFLFNMAKSFICIYGISNFSDNNVSAKELLQDQIIEFLIKRSINDCKNLATQQVLENIMKYGIIDTITKYKKNSNLKIYLNNFNEMVSLLKLSYLK